MAFSSVDEVSVCCILGLAVLARRVLRAQTRASGRRTLDAGIALREIAHVLHIRVRSLQLAVFKHSM